MISTSVAMLLLAVICQGTVPAVQADVPSRPSDTAYHTLVAERVTVFFRPSDSLKATRMLRSLEEGASLPGLRPEVPSGVELYLAEDETALLSLVGTGVPDWGAGVALPDEGRIVIPSFVSSRGSGWSDARLLRHEWAHIALHQQLDGLRIPRWFDEGYAEWASGGWDPAEGWRLRIAIARGRAELDSITVAWPRSAADASLAYLLSATAIEYLVSRSGTRGLEVLFRRWAEGGDMDDAFRRTYGVTLGQFEDGWTRYVRKRYGWLYVLSHSILFWFVGGLALLGLVHIRRGRDREGLARLRAEELPDAPAFWLEQNLPHRSPENQDAVDHDSDASSEETRG